MHIRDAIDADFDAIWAIFEPIARAGETYAFPRDIDRDGAYKLWMALPQKTYVAEEDGTVLGTYYLKANSSGPAGHVCNCGYMTGPKARGRGLATSMCEHSQQEARALGFQAMQFNLVVSTNTGAVRLWQKLGFDIVGTLPKAFDHPVQGFVDAHVMYKWLGG
jgi:L-amino acid N-acyltransferase YncA